jgi:hypothetical protein
MGEISNKKRVNHKDTKEEKKMEAILNGFYPVRPL